MVPSLWLKVCVPLTGERGAKGDPGTPGVGLRGEMGPPGIPGGRGVWGLWWGQRPRWWDPSGKAGEKG